MLTNNWKHFFRFATLLFSLTQFYSGDLHGQIVFENPKLPINIFLARQAQKGNIHLTDFILPMSRKDIAFNLFTLQDSIHKLSTIEKQELAFYLKEYTEFNLNRTDSILFFKKDPYKRWRAFSSENDGFQVRIDPVIGLETIQGAGKQVFKVSNGLQLWGHMGKKIGFQLYFTDILESGTRIDTIRQFNNETGIVRFENVNKDAKLLTYSNLRGSVSYEFKNGSIVLGNDQLLWGYGENGRIVMSDKAPAYPFVRLDYQPLKWLKFQYAHTWLQSAIVDSARSYPKGNTIYGSNREIFVSKFMATHSLNFFPVEGLSLSVGESIVYSDKMDLGYLIPVMIFKAYDQISSRYNINSGSNGQFFFQASSRNHIKGMHLYGTLFIDEIRGSEVFNRSKSRNQVGYNTGASITDLFLPYLSLGVEYTRINPFVYQNLIPAQSYTSQNYLMGDWIGQNAERLTAWLRYNPLPRLNTRVRLDYIRKGEDGSLEDQYYAEPQPGFLSSKVESQKQFLFEAGYELINNLHIRASYFKQAGIIRPKLQTSAIPSEFRFGLSFGF
ncbi:MAG: capsule assembly Wzi family protein [Bacteroidetes bacterium]|nr:capsule assembly Wzi family protein [Bacteroidota bacterium]